ncbi:MAG: hypothetical protein ACOYK9_05170 [Chlamydiia bacterium]
MASMRNLIGLVTCLVCFSCGSKGVQVDHYLINHSYLPSTFVRSPDPLQEGEFIGETVIISYNLPQEVFEQHRCIEARFVFKNLTEITYSIPLQSARGMEKIEWVNEEFKAHGPILGYEVEVGKYKTRSPLYSKIIEIDGRTLRP